ncbi:DUF2207 domain-containing protein [Flavobacterium salilacus subsp. salilacus]|uniref:hypothetical protein n=1 Tax=Flavobacterium TaxID=237 RepID=UPI001074E5C5|nr:MULTISPECIES: hypothetical protein [Flavobacterium]KAF2515089.1 DUF2207 domain-containing protein [Flavobacterium salilacus subsp. salilacus]MBE1615882.1 hypothetical protein [Flavobacterium sp. SaA2.13]
MNINKLYTFLLLLVTTVAFAQQPKVATSIDSTKIKIGSQFNLTLKTTVDTTARVNFPEGKNFGQLEVLESYPVDTVRKDAMYELVKKYGLTQFDSGRYVIPRLPVVINNNTIRTDSLLIEVTPVVVDTLKQKMYDIKDVATAESKGTLWLWILIGVVVAAGIAFGVWWFIKKRKKPQPKEEEVHYASPIEKATTQLKELENKALLQKGAVKDYYSELTDIARMYIEEAIHIPAMESTTGELIEAMRNAVRRKNMKLSQDTFEQLEKVLRNADLVKFAKMRPVEYEIAEDRSRIEKTIVIIDRSIPVENEEDEEHTLAWLEAQRKKEKQKHRNRNIVITIVSAIVVLGAAFFFVGRSIMREYVTGIPTKELLEGEWVKSAYGNPPVIIETPKVLKRQDPEQILPEGAMAMFKEMQIFTYGAMADDFYVTINTLRYKQQVEIDLNTTADGAMKMLETQGAKDILVKTEEFSTEGGMQGLRAYGTMSFPNPVTKKTARMYYEMIFFKQNNGLQQVTIMYREGDEYAPQLLDRVKNSIELTKLN